MSTILRIAGKRYVDIAGKRYVDITGEHNLTGVKNPNQEIYISDLASSDP